MKPQLKYFISASLFFLNLNLCLIQQIKAQDLGKEFSEFMNDIQDDYENSLKDYQKEYHQFFDSVNAGFIKTMQHNNKEFESLLKEEWLPHKMEGETPEAESSIGNISYQAVPLLPPIGSSAEESRENYETLQLDFFGCQIRFDYNSQLALDLPDNPSPEDIASTWSELNQLSVFSLIKQLYRYKAKMQLNDWAHYLMIRKLAAGIQDEEDEEIVCAWYLLIKAGYKAKIGISNQNLVLLLPFRQDIYGMKSINIGGEHYYSLDFDGDELKTYSGEYFDALKTIDLSIVQPMSFGESIGKRKIEFEHDKKHYSIDLQYNKDLVEFYQHYPRTGLRIYLEAPLSSVLRESLIKEVLPYMQDHDSQWKTAFLLSMLQKGFPYASDMDQFSGEKPFFADEMLLHQASDCEDRALFLSKMAELLAGQESLLAIYQNHVACAFQVSAISDKASKYTYGARDWICHDPSYIDAPPGQLLPGYSDSVPSFIEYPPPPEKKLSEQRDSNPEAYSEWSELRNKLPVEQLKGPFDLPFAAILNDKGELLYLCEDQPENMPDSIRVTQLPNRTILVSGILPRQQLQGAKTVQYEGSGDYKIVSRFMKEYEQNVETGSTSLIAFAWSVLKLLNESGVVIPGAQLSSLLMEAGLPNRNPLEEVRNSKGILEIRKTAEGIQPEPLILDGQASCRVYHFPDRMRMKILEGVYHGNSLHKDYLNYIDILKSENQIMYDYSTHYRKPLQMKSDLL